MPEFKQDDEETPVLFRVSDGEVVAVFPCDVAALHDYSLGCYAHIGQHSGCSLQWYHTTRKAKPEQYAALKRELESSPYGYRLKIYQRMTSQLRDRYMAERRRLLNMEAT